MVQCIEQGEVAKKAENVSVWEFLGDPKAETPARACARLNLIPNTMPSVSVPRRPNERSFLYIPKVLPGERAL